ncbi:MAG: anti-sigma factor family protein [Alphaproteobacteria bacterium]
MGPGRRLGRHFKALMMRRLPGMITCAEFERFVVEHYEGELSEGQRRRFERHMAMCPPCRVSWESYRKAVALGQGLFAEEERYDPAPVDEDLVTAVLAARAASREG